MKLLILMLTVVSLQGRADTAEEDGLPQSWFTVPEDNPTYAYDENEIPNPKAVENIERILSSTGEALDRMDGQMEDRSYAKEKKWYLAACVFDVTLSMSGVMGFFVAKGDATAAMYFRKKNPTTYDRVEPEDVIAGDATFTTADTEEEIEAKLEPVIRTAMATGQIKDEAALRRNLRRTIFDYHDVMGYLAVAPNGAWQLSRLRLDFSIDISGKVDPATTIGGGVRLRFEWEPVAGQYAMAKTKHQPYQLGDNLKKLLESLSQELNQVEYQGLAQTGFDLRQAKFAIGLFAEGNVGVMKIGGSIFGHVYFTRKTDWKGQTIVPSVDNVIPVIDTSEAGRTWAARHGLKTYGQVYSVPGEAFRKGLQRAVKITTWFAERREKKEKEEARKWELYQIKTEFMLSLSGGVALFRIGGAGSIELVFQKV